MVGLRCAALLVAPALALLVLALLVRFRFSCSRSFDRSYCVSAPSFVLTPPPKKSLAAFLEEEKKMLSFIVVRGSREAAFTLLHSPICVLA